MDEKQLQEMENEELVQPELQSDDDQVTPGFSLEDIMKEFGADAEPQEEAPVQEADEVAEEAPADEAAEETEEDIKIVGQISQIVAELPEEKPEAAPLQTQEEIVAALSGDTIRLDISSLPQGQVRNVEPVDDETDALPQEEEPATEPFSDEWEPEYEQPMGEYIPPQPIVFQPRSRLRELKRKLVAGPERRYYQLAEMGLGKLQFAIFLSILVVLLAACSTVLYAMGMVPENRLRLMIFGQFFVMLISALLGSFQLIEGVSDLFKKGFTMNTLLVVTFIVCCIDGVFCLQQLRIPCCAAFSLEVTMSLWGAHQRRKTEMEQMDTMRKAVRLDKLALVEDYYEGKNGLLRGEGQVEDFMEHYQKVSGPEKLLNWYALGAMVAAAAIGAVAGLFNGVYAGLRVAAVSLMAAAPVTAFITISRPMAVLERRLHAVGAVICGWKGIKGLCSKAVFPLRFTDLFPAGTTKMNGVKFFGNRETEQVIAYCTAVITSADSGLSHIFTQVLDSRNGRHYDAENLRIYDNGGIGGEVCGEPVLVGSLSFLKEMGVEVPEGLQVNQAVCIAIDGELCGLFAVTYEKSRAATAGLHALCNYRGLNPVMAANDFILTESFVRGRFGIKSKRLQFPTQEERAGLQQKKDARECEAMVLSTREGLAPYAYGAAGARALRKAWMAGVIIHMAAGAVGLGIMLTLTMLGRLDLVTPVHMFLYQLVWLIPGFLVTTWTRTV